ncbi:unnamed protein product, partial [Oppiella nova]
ICSPTSDKFDFRWKTCEFWKQSTKDQMRQLTYANIDVLIAAMKLQGLKYRIWHDLDIIDNLYTRFIEKAQKFMPIAYAVIETYQTDNHTANHIYQYYLGITFEEYRYMGAKLDILRKNMLDVTDTEVNLAKRWAALQKIILDKVLWAADYIRVNRQDPLWGSLHIQIHELVKDEFRIINADLAKIPSGDKKAKALTVLLEEIAICSPTTDKFDFRWKTCEFWKKCTKDQMRQLSFANIDVLIAAMKLQGLKYKLWHDLDIIDDFYQRFIEKAQKYLPIAYAVMDTYQPDNHTFNHINQYYLGVSFEEYRYVGAKLDISRKNQLIVKDTEENLAKRWAGMQETILKTVLWASDYIRFKREDTFWGSLHIQIHDLVQDMFSKVNADLDKMPSGEKKAKALTVLLEEVGILLI